MFGSKPDESDRPKFEQIPQALVQHDIEHRLWSLLTTNFQGVDPLLAEDYHTWASEKARTGEPFWWVRYASGNGVVIDHFFQDSSVGTLFCRNDLGFVEATRIDAARVLRTPSLPVAVEWIEEISTQA